ncbi:SDR family oxidoreductase [Humidisolicoccus flavus]|uniref:SDR family oxidoreductase n=1 Tax=Humidisolicoccus flavus TaxID=3111414 RepID=UPI00324F09B1
MRSKRTVWVLGGGTGIGEAVAAAFADPAYRVVVSGRRTAELDATVKRVFAKGGAAIALPADVTDEHSLAEAHAAITKQFGGVDILVYSAGTNVTNRFWDDTTGDDFAHVLDVNLTGVTRAALHVLPWMREQGDGLLVLISSWAGWRFSPGAGPAYSASKTAVGALAESINARERLSGIRATHLCPGEVKTDILNTRPVVPSEAAQALMLQPEDLGSAVRYIADLPARVCINELVISPTSNTSYA